MHNDLLRGQILMKLTQFNCQAARRKGLRKSQTLPPCTPPVSNGRRRSIGTKIALLCPQGCFINDGLFGGLVCFVCLSYSEGSFCPDDVSVIAIAVFRAAPLAWVGVSLKGKSAVTPFFFFFKFCGRDRRARLGGALLPPSVEPRGCSGKEAGAAGGGDLQTFRVRGRRWSLAGSGAGPMLHGDGGEGLCRILGHG